ncbi:polyubiquitin-binding protein UFD1 [Sugiyamaella lignohabitans]|uniref:Ubiquitin fusion degradation protein 1 n=1 Tax=Sugiyamaella lignohabitans TaxID=796027 RepID=A0A167FEQ3_9ASCO|nr:polyubiquitin-binding protein UFD1 [Sugiyamaella lignohabitans]ANB15205.1 polyubiquitin-binding protein UFD1 [Sugiyamaella lignohabitans]
MGFNMPPSWGGPGSQQFRQYFRCYPVAMLPGKERENINFGGKIVMPPSALNKLTMLHITYPMLFELKSQETELTTHAGVLEFIAEEGRVYIPQWMMETLALQPGSLIQVGSIDLPSGSFVKIEPQSTDFLDIYDPKAVLENALRNFSTLTVDDIFQISYNNHIYSIKVLEVKPTSSHNSICVVETDLEVDFAPPVGYVEPSIDSSGPPSGTASVSSNVPSRAFNTPVGAMASTIGYEKLVKSSAAASNESNIRLRNFETVYAGEGQKLSGKSITKSKHEDFAESESQGPNENEGLGNLLTNSAPALELPFGQLFFGYPLTPLKDAEGEKDREEQEQAGSSIHFQGSGQSLRQSRKRKKDGVASSSTSKRPNSPDVIEID